MHIHQRRIHSVHNYLRGLPAGSRFQISLTQPDSHRSQLVKIGFSLELNPGERILPRILAPVTRFNSDGFDQPQRDQAKETHYRDGMVKDWHGNWHYVDIPYQRYPRIHISAPSEEITIVLRNNLKIVTSRVLEYQPDNLRELERIKHIINLFLELFGECTIQSDALFQLHNTQIERRNWLILPTGDYPWEKAEALLQNMTRSLSETRRRLVNSRFQHLSEFRPDKLIFGQAGFDGYVVFCYEDRGLYVLESRFTNNATYVFGNNWESLSQLSKAEILNGDLYRNRLIHLGHWSERIGDLLKKNQAA